MPFIKRPEKPKRTRHYCDTPWWTWFIKADTLWQCGDCGTVWAMHEYDMGHNEGKYWIKYEGKV